MLQSNGAAASSDTAAESDCTYEPAKDCNAESSICTRCTNLHLESCSDSCHIQDLLYIWVPHSCNSTFIELSLKIEKEDKPYPLQCTPKLPHQSDNSCKFSCPLHDVEQTLPQFGRYEVEAIYIPEQDNNTTP